MNGFEHSTSLSELFGREPAPGASGPRPAHTRNADDTADGPAPRVSVVVPMFKEAQGARRAVLSLFGQDLDGDSYEIIAVDSSPDDSVVNAVSEIEGSARCAFRLVVKPPEGPGPSRNLGVEHARGEFIAFMDSDCQATPGWLRHGLAAFDDNVGIVQGRTLPEPGVTPGILTKYLRVEEENYTYEGANVFYRRSSFEKAGGFSHEYNGTGSEPMGGEDTDLAWRVKRNRWESRFCHEALVYHEIQPLPLRHYFFGRCSHLWPLLTKRIPELRQFFVARYFFDRHQAWLVVALAGIALALLTPFALALCVPYGVPCGFQFLFRGLAVRVSLRDVHRLNRPVVRHQVLYLSRAPNREQSPLPGILRLHPATPKRVF